MRPKDEIFDGKRKVALSVETVRRIKERSYARNFRLFRKLDEAAAKSRLSARFKIVF